MLRSMTAFAREEAEGDFGTVVWELRSVNFRYLDVVSRLPEELRALEPAVRERISARLRRGKIECGLRYQPAASYHAAFSVDIELAKQIANATRVIDGLLPHPAPIHAVDILRWPGVIKAEAVDLEALATPVLDVLSRALDALVATRVREGERIRELISNRCREVEKLTQKARQRLPLVIAGARQRLRERLAEVQQELDETRFEQEMVLFAQKLDVAEELERLDAHVAEVATVLAQDKPVGRQLDFLMQEMNREANTLGSKSADTATTRASVELKVIIEQMREQIQNIE